MSTRRRVWFGASLCAVVLSLGLALTVRASLAGRTHSETLYVFGTLVEVVISGASEDAARAATTELGHQFQRYHRDWHAWRDGELTRLNAAIAQGAAMDVSAELAALLHEGRTLSLASNGLFDPAIGGLIELWGFHSDTRPTGAAPTAAVISELVAQQPTMADLRLDGTRVSARNPAVQLDLGAYAKGAALERAAEILQARGIRHAVLNAGGDVKVLGQRGQRAWRVAIRDPFGWGAVAALSVHPGEAVFTSGNYERYLDTGDVRFSHIIDPRTGWPVPEIVSATVLATDGALADAAATALSVAGPNAWTTTAAAMGIDHAMLIDDQGHIYATPAMAARLEFPAEAGHQAGSTAPIIVSLSEDRDTPQTLARMSCQLSDNLCGDAE